VDVFDYEWSAIDGGHSVLRRLIRYIYIYIYIYQILGEQGVLEVQIAPDMLDVDVSYGERMWYIAFKWYSFQFDAEEEGVIVAALMVEPISCPEDPHIGGQDLF
jgi:hypothetical protein